MAQRKFRTNIVVSYEPDESGWIRASLPAMPEVATAGLSREDAREMVVDAAIQIHGGEGVSDPELSGLMGMARVLRIADGPDEVHKILIAKNVLKQYERGEGWDFGN